MKILIVAVALEKFIQANCYLPPVPGIGWVEC